MILLVLTIKCIKHKCTRSRNDRKRGPFLSQAAGTLCRDPSLLEPGSKLHLIVTERFPFKFVPTLNHPPAYLVSAHKFSQTLQTRQM